jgi:hypothetical protein
MDNQEIGIRPSYYCCSVLHITQLRLCNLASERRTRADEARNRGENKCRALASNGKIALQAQAFQQYAAR